MNNKRKRKKKEKRKKYPPNPDALTQTVAHPEQDGLAQIRVPWFLLGILGEMPFVSEPWVSAEGYPPEPVATELKTKVGPVKVLRE
jgi:hypothetical protein